VSFRNETLNGSVPVIIIPVITVLIDGPFSLDGKGFDKYGPRSYVYLRDRNRRPFQILDRRIVGGLLVRFDRGS